MTQVKMKTSAAQQPARRPSPPPPSSLSSLSASSAPLSMALPSRITVVVFFAFGGFCLQMGLLVGHDLGRLHCVRLGGQDGTEPPTPGGSVTKVLPGGTVTKREEELQPAGKHLNVRDVLQDAITSAVLRGKQQQNSNGPLRTPNQGRMQPAAAVEAVVDKVEVLRESNLIAGALHVKRNDFVKAVDVGVPIDSAVDGQKDDVLILYTSEESFPSGEKAMDDDENRSPAERALENCQTLKVVFTEHDRASNCLAVVGHPHESYHVHRFHRMPEFEFENQTQNVRPSIDLPLRQVPRTIETDGIVRIGEIPKRETMDQSLDELARYLIRLNGTLEALRPIAEAAAGGGKIVVAMTVNQGQSDLFVNFVCASQSRGLDISNLILFATDDASAKLARKLDVNVFEVGDAFGPMPTHAAGLYGDKDFARMVQSKVYGVHLLVLLGYDVLLQDVDVLWLRNPLEFLSSSRFKSFDVIFQDDGSRIPRFAPYFANTGFFFVKNNDRTVYLFNHLIRMGDVIKTVQCDQRAMSIVMNEIISWKGMRVKVLARDSEEGLLFPGGFHFHRRFEFMRTFLKDEVEPYIFHMSWTSNKAEKRVFLSQLGLWFVHSSCAGEAADDFRLPAAGSVSEACCAAEPIVQCHYSDMPSRSDCRELDPLVQDRVPFWSPANATSA